MNPLTKIKVNSSPEVGRGRSKSVVDTSATIKASSSPISGRAKSIGSYIEKTHYYILIPAFSFSSFVVDVNSEPIANFHYTLEKRISIINIPEQPENFNLIIVSDGVRYKIWDIGTFSPSIPLYTGQRLALEFDIEVWATDNNPVNSEEIKLLTSTISSPTELLCHDNETQEAYALAIPFMYVSVVERFVFNIDLAGYYWPLIVLDEVDSGDLTVIFNGSYYYMLEESASQTISLNSGQQFTPTFDSTHFRFDSTLLTWDNSPLTYKLVAHWKLDEANGNRADSYGLNTLVPVNNPNSIVGKIGDSAHFISSSSQSLDIAHNAELSMGDIDFTIATWVLYDSFNGSDFLSKGFTSDYLLYYDGGSISFFMSGESAIDFTTISLATWYFVVAWYDSVNSTLNIQTNNGIIYSSPQTVAITPDTLDFKLGGNEFGFLDGLIDSTSIWKRKLSAEERTALWNSGNGLSYPF